MANKRQCTVESILRGKIEEAKKGVKEFPEKRFVILEDLQRIWQTGHRDEFYTDKGKDWYRPFLEDCITSKLLRIMSILIMLRFNRWDKFGEIFLGPDIYREHADEELPENRRYRPKRCDDHLPFKREDLVDEGFLGMEDGEPFFMLQGNFCPLVIEERHEPYDLTPDGEHFGYRLPFLHRPPKEFASGASAKVFKEIIPPNHIRYFANLRPSTNFQNKAVACKRVLKEERFDKELNNLKELRRCLSQHSRIMVNIATIIEPGSKEPILHILYDLAAYDLNTFLTVELKERSISPLRRHDSAPPGRNGSDHYTAEDLIWESHNLADALDFLHYRLLYDEEVMCAHNDLKPNNILVFFPDSNDRDQRYPVGLWKIADFGISRLKDRKEGKYLDARHRRERSGSFSRTTSKREPGTYTAPEVKGEGLDQPDARYGDIWSFGCILSEILAFAVGGPVHGPKLVNELGRELLEKYEHQRFYDDKNKVKSELMPWLRSLPQKAPRREARDTKWVNQCADLIYNILNAEEPKKRPKAKEICDQLREIKKDMTKRTMKQPQKQTLIPLDGQIGMEEPDGDTLGMGSGDTEDGNPTIEFSYADSSCVESPANDDGVSNLPSNRDRDIHVSRDPKRVIERLIKAEGSSEYWIWGISDDLESQKTWKASVAYLKTKTLRWRCPTMVYYAPSAGEQHFIYALMVQLRPESPPQAFPSIDSALEALKNTLIRTRKPIFGIFFGFDLKMQSTMKTLLEAKNYCTITLIFFTKEKEPLLERFIDPKKTFFAVESGFTNRSSSHLFR